jgi:hypothetical protein
MRCNCKELRKVIQPSSRLFNLLMEYKYAGWKQFCRLEYA